MGLPVCAQMLRLIIRSPASTRPLLTPIWQPDANVALIDITRHLPLIYRLKYSYNTSHATDSEDGAPLGRIRRVRQSEACASRICVCGSGRHQGAVRKTVWLHNTDLTAELVK